MMLKVLDFHQENYTVTKALGHSRLNSSFFSLLIVILAMALLSCTGSEELDSQGTEGSESVEVVTISSVKSSLLDGALIIAGKNFTNDMTARLLRVPDGSHNVISSLNVGEEAVLEYTFDSPSEITVYLPETVDEGDFELTLEVETSSSTAALTLLKGPQGDPGQDGADGADGAPGTPGAAGSPGTPGINIVKQFSCSSSADLDPSIVTKKGLSVDISQFSDDSYHVSCMSQFTNVFTDTSSYSKWYPPDSSSVVAGVIDCVPAYVKAEYNIAGNSVVYKNLDDAAQLETVSCSQSYP